MVIAFFPYLFMREVEEFKFGDISIWNFDRKSSDCISDQTVRDHIARIFSRYQNNGRPVQGIGVVKIGEQSVFENTNAPLTEAKEIQLAAFLSVLAKQVGIKRHANTGHFMATSENFMLFFQNFEPGSDFIAERAGRIIQMTNGDEIDRLTYHTPHATPTPLQGVLKFEPELLNQLALCKTAHPRLFRKILLATESVFESYFNNDVVSVSGSILAMARAFEILLQLEDGKERKSFKEVVEKHTVINGEKLYNYKYVTARNRKISDSKPLKIMWADRFYTLRNKIIHGNKIVINDYLFRGKQPHFEIATIFFIKLVKAVLSRTFRRQLFFDEIKWERWTDDIHRYTGFTYDPRDLYRDWLRELREMRRAHNISTTE